jgi:hypothetical protein
MNKTLQYTESEIDKIFGKLTSSDNDLKLQFEEYIRKEYADQSEKLNYMDICEISRYIIDKVLKSETQTLGGIFDNVEEILNSCDDYIENLIVIGLFEGIQNIGGSKIDYYFGFNKWLKPQSKLKWDALIDSWEGVDWRKSKR